MQHTQAASRRRRLAAIVPVLLTVALALASAAVAAEGIMLQIKDAPLKDVVTLLTQQSGVNIVIVDESRLDQRVTATLNDVPLEKALDYVVRGSGVSYKKMDDGTYIIGGSLADEAPLISPDELTRILPPVEPTPIQAPSEVTITTIKLVHSSPVEILKALSGQGSGRPFSTESDSRGRTNAGAGPSIRNPGGGTYVVNNNSLAGPIEMGVRLENGQPVPPAYDPRGYPGAGRTGDVYTGAAQYPSPPVVRPGYAPPALPGTTRPTGTTGTTTTTTTTTGQGFLWPEGVEQIAPFDLDNSLLVKANEEGLEKLKKIIRMLDVPPKQVQIKAEFVVITTTDSKRFGIDWSLQRLNESFSTSFGPSGNVVFGFASGNLTAQLRAQLTNDVGRVVNSPLITTLNNRDAFINISNEIPYWVPINTVTDTQVIQQFAPQFISVETSLHVLPRVNGDNTITVQLDPQVSGTGDLVVGPDGTTIPATNNQSLFTERRVGNGETIVLGGFIRKHDSTSVQKIPILGDLPIIGSLFRTTAKSRDDQELLIFVTPTILPDPVGGTVGTGPVL